MPTVAIEMFPGRTGQQKAALVAEVTGAVVKSLGVDAANVRVKIYEIPREHSAQGGRLASDS